MINSAPTVRTSTYKSEFLMRRDIGRMLAAGYTVQSTSMTEHRGCVLSLLGILTLGILFLVLPKAKHYHVVYVSTPLVMPPPAPPEGIF